MLAVAECAQILYPRARCARVQEAKRNREIEVRDLQTATVLSSEVGPRRRTASPGASGGGARGGGATAADRLRELGAAFDAVLAATGAHPAGPMRRVVLRWWPPARALLAPCAGWLPRRRQARVPYHYNRLSVTLQKKANAGAADKDVPVAAGAGMLTSLHKAYFHALTNMGAGARRTWTRLGWRWRRARTPPLYYKSLSLTL